MGRSSAPCSRGPAAPTAALGSIRTASGRARIGGSSPWSSSRHPRRRFRRRWPRWRRCWIGSPIRAATGTSRRRADGVILSRCIAWRAMRWPWLAVSAGPTTRVPSGWPSGWSSGSGPMADGTVTPRANGRRSSFHETHATMWGLFEFAQATGDRAARQAAERAAELFLSHRVFRRGGSGEPDPSILDRRSITHRTGTTTSCRRCTCSPAWATPATSGHGDALDLLQERQAAGWPMDGRRPLVATAEDRHAPRRLSIGGGARQTR